MRTPWGGNFLQSINPFIAFDIGAIHDREHNYSSDTYSDLMGWATGMKITGKYYGVNVVYARPFNSPHWLSAAQEQWHFNVSINF